MPGCPGLEGAALGAVLPESGPETGRRGLPAPARAWSVEGTVRPGCPRPALIHARTHARVSGPVDSPHARPGTCRLGRGDRRQHRARAPGGAGPVPVGGEFHGPSVRVSGSRAFSTVRAPAPPPPFRSLRSEVPRSPAAVSLEFRAWTAVTSQCGSRSWARRPGLASWSSRPCTRSPEDYVTDDERGLRHDCFPGKLYKQNTGQQSSGPPGAPE